MSLDLNRDVFVFQISDTKKLCTRHELFSTLNSVFIPVRFHCYTDSRIFKLYPEISHACNRSRGKDSSDFPHQLSGFMYQPIEIQAMLRLDLLTKPQPSGILCIGGRPRNLWVRRFYPFTWSTSHCKLIVINFHKRTVVYLYFSSS